MTAKANQLRIENWFIQYDEPEQFDGDFYHLSDIKFIPLTEEWLFKLGFECIFTHDDHHYYLESLDLGLDRSYQPFGIGQYKLEFEYVHQLQNLYFALTGEELILKNNLK